MIDIEKDIKYIKKYRIRGRFCKLMCFVGFLDFFFSVGISLAIGKNIIKKENTTWCISILLVVVSTVILFILSLYLDKLADKRLNKLKSLYKQIKPKNSLLNYLFPNAIFLKGPDLVIITILRENAVDVTEVCTLSSYIELDEMFENANN